MINLESLEARFGSVTFEGRDIILADQPETSDRLLNEYPQHLTYQGDGDSYMVEYQTFGYDKNTGEKVMVFWHHHISREGNDVEGAYPHDMEEADYNWESVEKVEVL